MGTGVKELKLWQEAVALAADIIRAARQTSRRETKSFTDQLMRSAVDLPIEIAQGYALGSPTEQLVLYRAAKASVLALETELAVARQAGLLSAEALAQMSTRASTVSRLLSGYVGYVERQIAAEEALATTGGRTGAQPAHVNSAAAMAVLDSLGFGEATMGEARADAR